MPNTNEIFFKLNGIHYYTSLYLNIGYYHIQLTEGTSNLCTVILPW